MTDVDLINAINDLTTAVTRSDNHVVSDLDTYPVVTALNEVCEELKKTNLNLIAIRNELNGISAILEVR